MPIGDLFRYLGCGLLTILLFIFMIAGTIAFAHSHEHTLCSYVLQQRAFIVDVVTLACRGARNG
jgi:hypothetical protein